jgi:uncharacterized OB-fold protein
VAKVVSKLGQEVVADPLAREPDPYAEFRDVLRLEREQTFQYRHSLGKYSRFFLALEQGRLLATACPACGQVWLPPRPHCPRDLAIMNWTELSGRGTLMSWTEIPRAPRYADTGSPYILAYVALEGASTMFLQRLRVADGVPLEHGMPVKTVFTPEPVSHPLELFWFEPT